MTRSDRIMNHDRGWLAYWRGIDSKTNTHDDPRASWRRGLWKWVKGILYRGYATEDDRTPYEEDAYYCPLVWNLKNPLWLLVNLVLGLTVYLSVTLKHKGNPWAHVRQIRVHESGHLNGFGTRLKPIRAPPTAEGGLRHEPWWTLDVMLPGWASPLRLTDRRGLDAHYAAWRATGHVRTLREG